MVGKSIRADVYKRQKETIRADLSVNSGDLKLCNPVMTASGTFGYGKEFEDFVDLEKIGGIIVKGTTPVSYTHLDVYKRQIPLLN